MRVEPLVAIAGLQLSMILVWSIGLGFLAMVAYDTDWSVLVLRRRRARLLRPEAAPARPVHHAGGRLGVGHRARRQPPRRDPADLLSFSVRHRSEARGTRRQRLRDRCWRCRRATKPLRLPVPDYAELLGPYLGDGHSSRFARTERLRIHLDARYPTIVDDARMLLERCFPTDRVGRACRHEGSMIVLSVYHNHLSCLFPQTGPGKKHQRPIRLEAWQADVVEVAPWRFLPGCICSDGCVFVNRTGRYEHLSYEFSNLSREIVDLFVATCERLGLRPRRYPRYVRLYRREDAARLLAEVGTKF